MDDLIEALQLMATRERPEISPLHCEHDELVVCVSPGSFTREELRRLDKLGFAADKEDDCFRSFRFGSA